MIQQTSCPNPFHKIFDPEFIQHAVNISCAALLLDTAVEAGLVHGPRVNAKEFEQILEFGRENSINPSERAVVKIMLDNLGLPPEEQSIGRKLAKKLFREVNALY